MLKTITVIVITIVAIYGVSLIGYKAVVKHQEQRCTYLQEQKAEFDNVGWFASPYEKDMCDQYDITL